MIAMSPGTWAPSSFRNWLTENKAMPSIVITEGFRSAEAINCRCSAIFTLGAAVTRTSDPLAFAVPSWVSRAGNNTLPTMTSSKGIGIRFSISNGTTCASLEASRKGKERVLTNTSWQGSAVTISPLPYNPCCQRKFLSMVARCAGSVCS